jgi:hypothetical protein
VIRLCRLCCTLGFLTLLCRNVFCSNGERYGDWGFQLRAVGCTAATVSPPYERWVDHFHEALADPNAIILEYVYRPASTCRDCWVVCVVC